MKNTFKLVLIAIISCVLFSDFALAQEKIPKNELESILNRFINYRFGTVSIYRLKNEDLSKVRDAIKDFDNTESGTAAVSADVLKTISDPVILQMIEDGVKSDDDPSTIRTDIVSRGKIPPDAEIFDPVYNYYKSLKSGPTMTIEHAYLIATRPDGDYRGSVIAMVVSYNSDDILEKNLDNPGAKNIYTYSELEDIKMTDASEPYIRNLYELCSRRLSQGYLENRTADAQGIGNSQWFAGKVFGKTESLVSNEYDASSEDINKIKRISDIEPTDIKLKENELLISPDQITWKRYSLPMYYDDKTKNWIVDSLVASNNNLPKMGVELKYGIDDINYPSFWSERLTLSALWENVKLGFILPTSGWATLSKDIFQVDRTMTHAGFGISGEADFPIKVIPRSGIFHGSFAYVFGDAKEPSYRTRHYDPDNPIFDMGDKGDYLVRANGQLHYTFGIQIDNDYLMRFGFGGTIYSVENWMYTVDKDPVTLQPKAKYHKLEAETVGGVSGKVEFMSKNITTPFGASIQYFDEALGVNVWLQIPLIENTLALRVDAKGYFTAFKKNPRDWEKESVFFPMARFIVNF